MQQNEFPKLIMAAGTPRSGGNVTVFSFDSHPEVLVWPTEFSYFPFYKEISGDRKKVPILELNQAFRKESKKLFSKMINAKESDLDTSPVNTNELQFGEFDFAIFEQQFHDKNQDEVTALEYLSIIFKAFKKAHSQYQNKDVKYFMINLSSARGLDWFDDEIFENCFIIFSYREMKESYASLREKYFKLNNYDLKTFFSILGKKTSIYWLEHFRRLSNYARLRVSNSNFLIVSFKGLQNDPEAVLGRLCGEFKIESFDSLNSLTRLGVPYGGNANQEDMNTGKISNKPSKIKIPLCQFEQKMFDSFGLFNFIEKHEVVPIKFSKYDMLKSAFISAFFELPKDYIWYNKSNFSSLYEFIGRSIIFFNLCAVYIIMKNKTLTLNIIQKRNHHINHMTFWRKK